MGVAALVIGIISLIIGFIPFCGIIALIPAIIGIILGIVDIRKRSKTQEKKGIAIAGLICSCIATIVILFWSLIGAAVTMSVNDGLFDKAKEAAEKTNRYIYMDTFDM